MMWTPINLLVSVVTFISFTSKATCFQSTRFLSVKKYSLKLSSTEMSPAATVEGPELPSLKPNSKRIFWVRHGEVINPGGDRPVYYGCQDVSLSEMGKQEAKVAGLYLQQFDLSHVFSSTLRRAIYGAEQVRKLQSNLSKNEVIQLDGFKELDRGEWCGKTKSEIGKQNLAAFDACDESVTPVGGESYPQLKERVLKTRDSSVLSEIPMGRAAAVVSHLQVTRSIVSDAMNIPTSQMVEQVSIATASVTCIDYDYTEDGIVVQTVHFQSFKPDVGLQKAADYYN